MIEAPGREAQAAALPLPRIVLASLPFVALVLGGVAQTGLDEAADVAPYVVVFALAASLFAWSTRSIELESAGEQAAPRLLDKLQPVWVVIALVFAGVAFIGAGGNRFRPAGVIAWMISVGLYLYALPHAINLPAAWDGIRVRFTRLGLTLRWEVVALALITGLGAFFRFYKLDAIPAEMGPDLPLKYLNIQEILNGHYLVFFPSHPGREPLFFYYASILARLFGNAHLTIKVAAALVGAATIPVLFAVARRLFNTEVALYASLLLAVNNWHIILSRIGFRAILEPLFIFVFIYLIAHALDRQTDWSYAFVGLWLGLGLYTYNSWLFVPVAFVLALFVYLLAGRNLEWPRLIRFALIAAGAALLVWAPLARYGLDDPDMYLKRVATRITSAEQPLPPDVPAVLLDNVKRTFAMFNYRGDPVFIENVPFMREFGFFTAVLFVLGSAYAVFRWRRGYNSIILVLFAAMLMPSALSIAFPQEVPNADRASAGMALAVLLAALTLPLVRQQLVAFVPVLASPSFSTRLTLGGRLVRLRARLAFGSGWIVVLLAVVLFAAEAREAYNTYFVEYVSKLPFANYAISREMARALDEYAGNGREFIKDWPYWFDGNALRVQLQKTTMDDVPTLEQLDPNAPPLQGLAGPAMFIVNPQDKQALELLARVFPNGVAVNHYDSLGNIQFTTFYIQG